MPRIPCHPEFFGATRYTQAIIHAHMYMLGIEQKISLLSHARIHTYIHTYLSETSTYVFQPCFMFTFTLCHWGVVRADYGLVEGHARVQLCMRIHMSVYVCVYVCIDESLRGER
jgi:hypothetical protein